MPWLFSGRAYLPADSRARPSRPSSAIVAWLAGGVVAGLAIMTIATVATHVVLAIGGAARGGFSQTVAVAYGFGSAAPLFILPYCGWPIFAVAGTVSAAFGLASLPRHRRRTRGRGTARTAVRRCRDCRRTSRPALFQRALLTVAVAPDLCDNSRAQDIFQAPVANRRGDGSRAPSRRRPQ